MTHPQIKIDPELEAAMWRRIREHAQDLVDATAKIVKFAIAGPDNKHRALSAIHSHLAAARSSIAGVKQEVTER